MIEPMKSDDAELADLLGPVKIALSRSADGQAFSGEVRLDDRLDRRGDRIHAGVLTAILIRAMEQAANETADVPVEMVSVTCDHITAARVGEVLTLSVRVDRRTRKILFMAVDGHLSGRGDAALRATAVFRVAG